MSESKFADDDIFFKITIDICISSMYRSLHTINDYDRIFPFHSEG